MLAGNKDPAIVIADVFLDQQEGVVLRQGIILCGKVTGSGVGADPAAGADIPIAVLVQISE